MLQSHSQQTNGNYLFFSKDSFYQLAGCRSSVAECLCVKQAVLGSIPSGEKNIFNSVLFKKACERERIHLMSKRRLRKKL